MSKQKITVEFTVFDPEAFHRALQVWDSTIDNSCLGYRIDAGLEQREALRRFSSEMEMKLRKNDHKTGWRDLPVEALFRLMALEIEEFKVALQFLTVREAMKELPDIANFAMMLWDRLGIHDTGQGVSVDGFARIEL